MRPYGLGILPDSEIYFYTPKESDKSLFLYPLCVGHYFCQNNYLVDRVNYDSFLLLHVLHGSVFIEINNTNLTIEAGDYAIIDCYKPHIYGSSTGCELMWVHFDGALARQYYEYILNRSASNSILAADSTVAFRYLDKLFHALCDQKPVDAALISKYLLATLTEFMYQPFADAGEKLTDIEKARIFIHENLDKPITLEEIAKQANLSIYYFTRRFRKEFGTSPHDYLIQTRLKTACFYLVSSSLLVKEIAFRCGFGNESNFCTCFRKNLNCTPEEYRTAHLAKS